MLAARTQIFRICSWCFPRLLQSRFSDWTHLTWGAACSRNPNPAFICTSRCLGGFCIHAFGYLSRVGSWVGRKLTRFQFSLCFVSPSLQCQVSTLASSEFAAVLMSVQDQNHQMRLASEWHLAMDVILTEIKAQLPWLKRGTQNFNSRFRTPGLFPGPGLTLEALE